MKSDSKQKFFKFKDENGKIYLIPKVKNLLDSITPEQLQKINIDPDNLAKEIHITDKEIDNN